jgi:hypothetical protein
VLTPASQRRMSQVVEDARTDSAVRAVVLSASQRGHVGTVPRQPDDRAIAGSIVHGTQRRANARPSDLPRRACGH